MRKVRLVLLTFAPTLVGACAHPGFLPEDGLAGSLSVGRADHGRLEHGRLLPAEGIGYASPLQWRLRGRRYGTDELVGAIERAARTVEEALPGGVLGVGDLSRKNGGRSRPHKSHENGRDADLIFYAVDRHGEPLPPAATMLHYDRRLASHLRRRGSAGGPRRYFDVARNWALLSALLGDPDVEVEYVFIASHLRARLLRHAVDEGEPAEIVARAAAAMRSPGRNPFSHDDHMHVRIMCDPRDAALGCVDSRATTLRASIHRQLTRHVTAHSRLRS